MLNHMMSELKTQLQVAAATYTPHDASSSVCNNDVPALKELLKCPLEQRLEVIARIIGA